MLNTKAWVCGKLKANTALTTLLGGADRIGYMYPNDFTVMPQVCYQELNQSAVDEGYKDNFAISYDTDMQIDVWTANNVSTSSISIAVSSVMEALLFNLDSAIDVPDPDTKLQHKVLRFSRRVIAEELI